MGYLHENRIVYRDLKPENLLIAKNGYLKLSDFGFAKRLVNTDKTFTLCGTPEYIAPEILQNKGHGFSVDWWALGILIYEMFLSHPPYVHDNPMMIYRGILSGKVEYPDSLLPKARDFIGRLLVLDYSKRLGCGKEGAPEVQRHAFFKGVGWNQVLRMNVRAPYLPTVDDAADTQHFDQYSDESDN